LSDEKDNDDKATAGVNDWRNALRIRRETVDEIISVLEQRRISDFEIEAVLNCVLSDFRLTIVERCNGLLDKSVDRLADSLLLRLERHLYDAT
jgi:hypothetical protein